LPFDNFFPSRPTGGAMRVALFSGNYNYTLDGANLALNRLVARLGDTAQARFRVYSPTTDRPAFPPAGELVPAPSLPIPGRPDYRLSLGLPRRLRQDVESFAPDLIHLSAPDPLGFEAQKLARRLGVPVVASVHTLFDTYLDYYPLGWLKAAVRARLRAFYDACDYVLAPTQAMADELEASGLKGRARVWSRGVDGDRFSPAKRDANFRRSLGLADEDIVVAFCGRLVMEKGLAVFAEAVTRAAGEVRGLRCLVIGDGPARGWLADRMPEAVFAGFLTGDPLAAAMAGADIFFNPSSTEAFCNVTLEAMASGRPVVLADAANNRSLLGGREAGLLRSGKDAPAFADALAELALHPERRDLLGRAARERALCYRWDDILDHVAATYREAIANSGSPGRLRLYRNSQSERAAKAA
jgi:glycosyltransferase involved in cell wall biosynthesis